MSATSRPAPVPPAQSRRLLSRRHLLALLGLIAAGHRRLALAAPAADAGDWSLDPMAAKAAELLSGAERARWIAEGSGPRVVYIFIDPNCPFSHQLFLDSRRAVGKDGLQIRWVIVGVLHESSLGKAAAILASPDPLAALQKNENDWDFGEIPGGGIRPLPHPDAALRQTLAANFALLQRAGIDSFPVLVWRNAKGQARMLIGLPPPDIAAEIFAHAR